MTTNEKVEIILKALEDKKADNIEKIDVTEKTSLSEYFIIASCQSTVQVRSCVDEVEEKLEEKGIVVLHKEGYHGGTWILMDYGDVVVHVMQQETRDFYDIERLWNSAPMPSEDEITE